MLPEFSKGCCEVAGNSICSILLLLRQLLAECRAELLSRAKNCPSAANAKLLSPASQLSCAGYYLRLCDFAVQGLSLERGGLMV